MVSLTIKFFLIIALLTFWFPDPSRGTVESKNLKQEQTIEINIQGSSKVDHEEPEGDKEIEETESIGHSRAAEEAEEETGHSEELPLQMVTAEEVY